MRKFTMGKVYVGIDISKLTFDAAIKVNDKYKLKSFSNNKNGFKKFAEWLQKFSVDKCHCCMESTGKYGEALALFLHKDNHLVSIVNPARIKYFMKSQLTRNKTDAQDARLIRQYAELFKPSAWKPLCLEIEELRELVKRRDALNNTLLQEQNRLENVNEIVKKSIDEHITYLKNEIKVIEKMSDKLIQSNYQLKKDSKLLRSIPGMGPVTTEKTLAFLGNVGEFSKAKKMASFVGLTPQHAQSGTSLDYSHISKTGDAELRRMFYMPALVAIKHEPSMKIFYEKLIGKGKLKKVAICAVMRKLVHISYGVLKSQKPFDPQLIAAH